jgi:hypothetical protein
MYVMLGPGDQIGTDKTVPGTVSFIVPQIWSALDKANRRSGMDVAIRTTVVYCTMFGDIRLYGITAVRRRDELNFAAYPGPDHVFDHSIVPAITNIAKGSNMPKESPN